MKSFKVLVSIIIVFSMIFCVECLTGCSAYKNQETSEMQVIDINEQEGEVHKDKLPFDSSLELIFSSGVGAWRTIIDLNSDGSFTGSFSDSNMGDVGNGYENGTIYICYFKGQFNDIVKVNEYTYSMRLNSLHMQNNEGEEWLEDNIKYIASNPYGIENAKELLLYTPETPTNVLSEEFLLWWQGYYGYDEIPSNLGCYGLYSIEDGTGFFSYE